MVGMAETFVKEMDFIQELSQIKPQVALSALGAARWLSHLTMPPELLARCLTVHTHVAPLTTQNGTRLATPTIIAQLPIEGRFGGQLDFADVLLNILQLLVKDDSYTSVSEHPLWQ